MNSVKIINEKYFPTGHVAIQVFLDIETDNQELDLDILNKCSCDISETVLEANTLEEN